MNQDGEVEQMIASYKRSNQQLSNQVGDQRKQILQLQEKLKESASAVQKVANQKALKEQLEVHIQTIGILVSEKSELQSNLSTIQKKLSSKDLEINDLTSQFKAAQTKVQDFEKNANEFKEVEDALRKVSQRKLLLLLLLIIALQIHRQLNVSTNCSLIQFIMF